MKAKHLIANLSQLIVQDKKLSFTILSYISAVAIFLNLSAEKSPIIGIAVSILYIFINATFLGNALFSDEKPFTRFLLGELLLIVIVSIVGWLVMIIYNLDNTRTTVVLLVTASFAAILNKRMKSRNAQIKAENRISHSLRAISFLYLLALALAFYFVYVSHRDEVLTVWGVIHPAFIPTFIAATFLLLVVIFSDERLQFKLLFTILHSILCHSLMVIIFPAGNVGVQQTVLGQTRLVFDNIIFHGLGSTRQTIPEILYVSFRGQNLQTTLSVIFARMLGVDVYWTHLFLAPLLWGTFAPLIAFLISKTLNGSEKISTLASLITSLFPTTILWGAASIPNAFSYLFFFCFLFFLLRYIKRNGASNLLLVVAFFLVSSMFHFLAGAISFALFILAYSIKNYEEEKWRSPVISKLTLVLSFILSVCILPFALVNRGFFYPTANTHFTLQKLYELSSIDAILSILLGRYHSLISREAYITTVAFGLPVFVSIVALLYLLMSNRHKPNAKARTLIRFIILSFILIAIDDRITSLFMTNVPFIEIDRLWVFRDLLLVPFAALFVAGALSETRAFFERISKSIFQVRHKTRSVNLFPKKSTVLARGHLAKGISIGSLIAYVLIFLLVSGWVNASVYYSYPHWAPLQTTSYELEAVNYIDETTEEKYIVIADPWTSFAGQMFVGLRNPRAFYFSGSDPGGISLFIKLKYNPSNDSLVEAFKYNNSTVAYFVIGKPRVGTEVYNDIIQQAQQNGLKTYQTFDYQGEEKMHIFYHERA